MMETERYRQDDSMMVAIDPGIGMYLLAVIAVHVCQRQEIDPPGSFDGLLAWAHYLSAQMPAANRVHLPSARKR